MSIAFHLLIYGLACIGLLVVALVIGFVQAIVRSPRPPKPVPTESGPPAPKTFEEIVGNDELATSLLRWMAKADFSQIAQLSELLKDDAEFLWAREH